MSAKLEKLLALLDDDQWHDFSHIMANLKIHEDELRKIITFLTKAGLVESDPTMKQVKLDQTWRIFLVKQGEKDLEAQEAMERPTIGTIIIPPQKTLIIQCTRITNLTDNSLELGIRMDKRIREIAIDKVK